jgi:hypothetical protein
LRSQVDLAGALPHSHQRSSFKWFFLATPEGHPATERTARDSRESVEAQGKETMTPGKSAANEGTYRHYTIDIARLKEQAREAKHDSESGADSDRSFAAGRLIAHHEVISLMQQQAETFGLHLSALGLDDINPDTDLG